MRNLTRVPHIPVRNFCNWDVNSSLIGWKRNWKMPKQICYLPNRKRTVMQTMAAPTKRQPGFCWAVYILMPVLILIMTGRTIVIGIKRWNMLKWLSIQITQSLMIPGFRQKLRREVIVRTICSLWVITDRMVPVVKPYFRFFRMERWRKAMEVRFSLLPLCGMIRCKP